MTNKDNKAEAKELKDNELDQVAGGAGGKAAIEKPEPDTTSNFHIHVNPIKKT